MVSKLRLAVLLVCTLAFVRSQTTCPLPQTVTSQLSFNDELVSTGCANTTQFTCDNCLCGLATSAFNQLTQLEYDLVEALGPDPTVEDVTAFFSGCTGEFTTILARDQMSAVLTLTANQCNPAAFPVDCLSDLLGQLGTNGTEPGAPPAPPAPQEDTCLFPEEAFDEVDFSGESTTAACDGTEGLLSCDTCMCSITTTTLNGLQAAGLTPAEIGQVLINSTEGAILLPQGPNDLLLFTSWTLLGTCNAPMTRRLLAANQSAVLEDLTETCDSFYQGSDPHATNATIDCMEALADQVVSFLQAAGGQVIPPGPIDPPSPPPPPPNGTLAGGVAVPGLGLGSGVWSLVVAAVGAVMLGMVAVL